MSGALGFDEQRWIPEGFDYDIPLKDMARLETREEAMNVSYREGNRSYGVRERYGIDEAIKSGWVRCSPEHPDAVRVSLLRFKRPYRYIDDDLLRQKRLLVFGVAMDKLKHRAAQDTPKVPVFAARFSNPNDPPEPGGQA